MAVRSQSDHFPILLGGILFGVIISFFLIVSINITPEQAQDVKMSYADFITIMLTAVTVVITILAVFVATLALWGYSQFQKMTESASRDHLNKLLVDGPFAAKIEAAIIKHVSEQLQNGSLRKVLVERVDSIILNDASQRAERGGEGEDRVFAD